MERRRLFDCRGSGTQQIAFGPSTVTLNDVKLERGTVGDVTELSSVNPLLFGGNLSVPKGTLAADGEPDRIRRHRYGAGRIRVFNARRDSAFHGGLRSGARLGGRRAAPDHGCTRLPGYISNGTVFRGARNGLSPMTRHRRSRSTPPGPGQRRAGAGARAGDEQRRQGKQHELELHRAQDDEMDRGITYKHQLERSPELGPGFSTVGRRRRVRHRRRSEHDGHSGAHPHLPGHVRLPGRTHRAAFARPGRRHDDIWHGFSRGKRALGRRLSHDRRVCGRRPMRRW